MESTKSYEQVDDSFAYFHLRGITVDEADNHKILEVDICTWGIEK